MNHLPVTCISDAGLQSERTHPALGQSSTFPCRHILSALPKCLKRARKVNYVFYKHSWITSMKIRVNNSLTTKHSVSRGWDFCVSRAVAVPVAGWQ